MLKGTKREFSAKDKAIVKEHGAFVALCFGLLEGETRSYHEIAELSGLSPMTIHNLWNQGVTPYTHALTLSKLGKAAGIEMYHDHKGTPRVRLLKQLKAS